MRLIAGFLCVIFLSLSSVSANEIELSLFNLEATAEGYSGDTGVLHLSYDLSSSFGIAVQNTKSPFQITYDRNMVAVDTDLNSFGFYYKFNIKEWVKPYVRIDYVKWKVSARTSNILLAEDSGSSGGVSLGIKLHLFRHLWFQYETSRVYDVSGSDIDEVKMGFNLTY